MSKSLQKKRRFLRRWHRGHVAVEMEYTLPVIHSKVVVNPDLMVPAALHKLDGVFNPVFRTDFGRAYAMNSLDVMKEIPDGSVDLIVTSPPYALVKKKQYGNEEAEDYVQWFMQFAQPFYRILAPKGSLVLNIGGSYERGRPTRSLCHFEVMLKLCKEHSFYLAQEFYWHNPAKMPAPAQWVTITRQRVRDSVEPVWWLSKDPEPQANNRKVLAEYGQSMRKLLEKGYNAGFRPSGHVVSERWGKDLGGAIPSNVLNMEQDNPQVTTWWRKFLGLQASNVIRMANTSATDRYRRLCKEKGILYPHPATFPVGLPLFFVKFLTKPGQIVFDPFGGSGTTGAAAQAEKRYWITCDSEREYVVTSKFRFPEKDDELVDDVRDIAQRHAELESLRTSQSRKKRRVLPQTETDASIPAESQGADTPNASRRQDVHDEADADAAAFGKSGEKPQGIVPFSPETERTPDEHETEWSEKPNPALRQTKLF